MLLEQLPALSHFYPAISPLVIDGMTTREVSEYVTYMARVQQAEAEAVRANG